MGKDAFIGAQWDLKQKKIKSTMIIIRMEPGVEFKAWILDERARLGTEKESYLGSKYRMKTGVFGLGLK